MNALTVVTYVLGAYSLLLPIIGVIGNLLSIYICTRKSLRKITTFVLLAFMATMDTLPLVTISHTGFAFTFFSGSTLSNRSLIWCKILYFLNYCGLHSSAYLLVALSFDRLMCVRIPMWRKVYFNSKRAFLLGISIVTVFILVNFHINFTFIENVYPSNKTGPFQCVQIDMSNTWAGVNIYMQSLIPFGSLIVLDSALIYSMAIRSKKGNSVKKSSKIRSLNVSTIASALVFIILSIPILVYKAYFSKYGMLWTSVFGLMQMTRAGLTFFLQCIYNRVFFEEVKILFLCSKKQQQAKSDNRGTTHF